MRWLCLTLLLVTLPLHAQTVTGSVVGTVADSSGSVVPGVRPRLLNEATGAARDSVTDQKGAFVFSAVSPGTYRLVIEQTGFRRFEKKELVVSPNEWVAISEVRLEVGAVTETITVTAEGATVQTASSERSGLVTSNEVENLTVINRDFSVLVSLQPGVVMEPGAETQGFAGDAKFHVQGGRQSSNNFTLDGQGTESSNAYNRSAFVSMDAISTVRILVSNFQAEFGRKPGAGVQAVTKSGTRAFHGALYWYKRHEQFNANSFFNN